MRAVQLTAETGPAALEAVDVPAPTCGDDQVLVDVHAAGVSFVDLLMSRGGYQHRPPVPFIPGIEVAGVVSEAPAGAALHVGDRVAASVSAGGYAEVVAAPVSATFELPPEISFAAGTALAVNYQTALFALVRRGHLAEGQQVLVQGAGGGVGTACIQVAKALRATVTAVVHTERTASVAKDAGADTVVVADDGWPELARAAAPRGYQLVVDPVGGATFDHSVRLLAPEGRLLVVGFAAGDIPQLRVNRLLLRNVDVVGVGWGAFVAMEPSLVASAAAELAAMTAAGFIRPIIGPSYPLAEAGAALSDLEKHSVLGKPVLAVR